MIDKKNFCRIVGENIRKIREEDKMISQEYLGELTEFDRTYIGSIERGEKNVSFYAIYKIIVALDIDPTDFFNQI